MKIYGNRTILDVRGALAAFALVMLFSLASCSTESDFSVPEKGDETSELQLHLAIETDGYTRNDGDNAVAADERRIDDLLVMLFTSDGNTPGTLWKSGKARRISPDGGEGRKRYFDIHFSMTGETDVPKRLCVATLANSGASESSLSALKGKSYAVVQSNNVLWEKEAHRKIKISDEDAPLFTMWGISADKVETDTKVQNISMTLVRDMAKVTVRLKKDGQGKPCVAGDPKFRLAHALVFNRRTDIALMPDLSNVSFTDESTDAAYPYEITKPTVSKDNNGLADLGKGEGYEDNASPDGDTISIYVPEQDIMMGTAASVNDSHALERPALIVGGHYGGDTEKVCWYRVDFTSGRDEDENAILADVLRNHHYCINIGSVNGPGEDTPEEAYGNLQAKIDSEVMEWQEHEWDAEMDGSNWIAAQREATVGPDEGAQAIVTLRSNVPASKWSLNWDVDGLFEAVLMKETAGTQEGEEGSEMSGGADTAPETETTFLLIKALQKLPDETLSRNAVLTIDVTPNLKFIINVVQDRSKDSEDTTHDDWIDYGFSVIL